MYCANNPINIIDPDGKDPIHNPFSATFSRAKSMAGNYISKQISTIIETGKAFVAQKIDSHHRLFQQHQF